MLQKLSEDILRLLNGEKVDFVSTFLGFTNGHKEVRVHTDENNKWLVRA